MTEDRSIKSEAFPTLVEIENAIDELEEGEKVTAVLPVKSFDDKHYAFMATSFGKDKKKYAE